MDITFEHVSVGGKDCSSFDLYLAEIFKYLSAMLFIGHPVYIPKFLL